jgi:hypothetical protein
MVHPANSKAPGSSSSSGRVSLLKKPAASRLQQPKLSFTAGSSSNDRGPRQPKKRVHQISIHELAGVVHYREDEEAAAGVGHTLYLGEEEVYSLKATLEDASRPTDSLMRVLRRLSAMPCTRALLETTRIGVAVGRLRRHDSTEVSELAARLVAVWKAQLAREPAKNGSRRPRA